MKAFATLLDRLTYTPARNAKLTLMRNYFTATPDPDRGYGLAALTDGLPLSFPLRRVLTELAASRFDAELFRLSRDYVGDTAETVALIWQGEGTGEPLPLHAIVEALQRAPRDTFPLLLASWLDRLDAVGRWALLKFIGGAPRVGVSARLAKQAVADAFGQKVEDIEEVWHGLSPPYLDLFDWLEDRTSIPPKSETPSFLPLMLSNPLEDQDWQAMEFHAFAAEWKWDGIRVQLSRRGNVTRIFSRSGDDISHSFPELVEAFQHDAVLDGEMLVLREGHVAPFADLQQRLNRKNPSRPMQQKYPVHVRLYDALSLGGEDVRALPWHDRRKRLEHWFVAEQPHLCDLSEVLSFDNKDHLQQAWGQTRDDGVEGLMLKRKESPYLAGRPKGHWYKWKRAALTADCVLLYARRGSGKRSSFYSDYTFAAWDERDGKRKLVPVGKAYSGFTDEELQRLDRFVRQHTIERFGPVRSVEPKLVLEVAFDAVQLSGRHKSGIAMRFPRIHRIRWDKPAEEADTLETLRKLI